MARILFIDDDPKVRNVVTELLIALGHTVVEANGGGSGLKAFRMYREQGAAFDVVITDLGMPHVDGREGARTVKEMSAATPVILLTGWGSRMKGEGNLPAQVDRVLSKPPQMSDLHEALRSLAGAS